MVHNAVRIGRVRPKTGGDIHVLPAQTRTDPQQGLIESAAELTSEFADLVGFVVVAWDETGTAWCHSWIEDPPLNPISPSMAPTFVHDAVYTHLLVETDLLTEED